MVLMVGDRLGEWCKSDGVRKAKVDLFTEYFQFLAS